MTAQSLLSIANQGGPRCCKRDSFLAISEAVTFMRKELGVALEQPASVLCDFSDYNHECKRESCPFYR